MRVNRGHTCQPQRVILVAESQLKDQPLFDVFLSSCYLIRSWNHGQIKIFVASYIALLTISLASSLSMKTKNKNVLTCWVNGVHSFQIILDDPLNLKILLTTINPYFVNRNPPC